MSFKHLEALPELYQLAAFANEYACTDPQSALVKMRCLMEKLVGEIYKKLSLTAKPNANIIERIDAKDFKSAVQPQIIDKLHAIRKSGNRAAHEGKVSQQESVWILQETYFVSAYFVVTFAGCKVSDIPAFVAPDCQKQIGQSDAEFAAQNKQLQQRLVEQEARLKIALEELEAAEAAQLKAQQEAAKLRKAIDDAALAQAKINYQTMSGFDFNEAQTRARIIDMDLRAAGWDVSLDNSSTEQVRKEFEVDGQPTATGKGRVDYVLFDDDEKPLAVIEAKRTRESVEKGQQQAILYADALEKRYGRRPVIFYSNGYEIRLKDDAQGYAHRPLYGYYSKDSLQYLIKQRDLKQDLNKTPIDTKVAGRMYQIESISQVCEHFSKKNRKALVVQATGTGKTRVSIALAKRLLDAGWAKRVLFLCDRKELRKQAANAFSEHTKEPLYVVGKSKKEAGDSARVFIATYPGMMRIFQQYDVGFFDLIIADESHRSIYNIYGDIFKYFDALEVGLTATPIEMISRSTCGLFECKERKPTANYPLERAITEHNLVPYKIVSFTTKFMRDGIKKDALTDAQIAELEEQGIDVNELDFDASQIDEAVKNKDTNRVILRNLMEKGLRDADGQLPGKTIVFARNIKHAELLATLFNEMYPQLGANFCRVIHSKYERAEELIDDFKTTDENSVRIAVSVDMLDTGIDVPEVVNLVFAKPIRSKVKFWQMIGRGTRLCKDLYGPGQHKSHFLIFDHWDNFAYFDEDPDEEDVKSPKALTQKLFEARLELAETALKKAEMAIFSKVIELIHADICALDMQTIAVRDNWRAVEAVKDLKRLDQYAPETKKLLWNDIAPLMQWRNIMGQADAYRFDHEIAIIQTYLLTDTAKIDSCRAVLIAKIERLQMHLNEVRAKAAAIAAIQKEHYWQQLSFEALEDSRLALRGIIHLRDKAPAPITSDLVLDIKEEEGEYRVEERTAKISSVDYEIYRQEVEKTLAPLFDTDLVLKKIRAGESVTEEDLARLNSLVHTQNPNVDLNTLKEFFPDTTVSLDKILRTIVGMDQDAIEQVFTNFIQQTHTHMNAKQQRFIGLLKNHLVRYGAITVEALYQQPFTSVHDMGLDGVFSPQQADVVAQFIRQFDVPLGKTIGSGV